MTPPETFVCHLCLGNGADVVVVVARSGFAVFAVARGVSFVDELPTHQAINLGDHRALAHAEHPRDGIRTRPALALLPRVGNQVSIDLELVGV